MNAIIIYWSKGGNTEKVAMAIEEGLKTGGADVLLKRVEDAGEVDFYAYDLVCLGFPAYQWSVPKPMEDFLSAKFGAYRKQGRVKVGCPVIPGKNALIFCTYSGPHTGIREAIPAGLHAGQFFEHLGFAMVGEWYVVGQFHGSEENSTQGRLGNIWGRPNSEDLARVKQDAVRVSTMIREAVKRDNCSTEHASVNLGDAVSEAKRKSQYDDSPPGAGRSSYELVNMEILFRELRLKTGSVFVDLGCGRGEYALEAAARGAGMVFGVDLWEAGITALRQEASARNLKNVVGLISHLDGRIPLDDHSIDICFMATVLHDLVRSKVADKALDQVKRILKKEGVLAIVEFKKVHGPPGPPIGIRLAPEEVEQIVSPYALLKKKLVEIGVYHYLITFSF